MSDYYETDGLCRRCLRSSPACSLIGLIMVFLGTVGFGTGAILFRRYLMADVMKETDFAWIDFIIYGLIGAIALFTIIAYIICSISTGYNSKRCFDTSRKSCCGRCCNMFMILCLAFGIILWLLVFSFTSLVTGNYLQLMSSEFQQTDDYDFQRLFQSKETPNENTIGLITGDVDLSNYGISKIVSKLDLNEVKEKMFLCLASAYIGEFFILIGYIIMMICVGMNYARLQERRYFEVDDGDETIALR